VVKFTTQFCCIGHIDVKYVILTSKDGEKVASHTDSHSEAQTIRVAPKPHLPGTADNAYEVPLLFALAGTLLIGCTHLFATKIRRLF